MSNTKSIFLSLILRHKPETVGLTLDEEGWALVSDVVEKAKIPFETLITLVENNGKKRFDFNEDRTMIRANQGHSLGHVKIEFDEVVPDCKLYHGTAEQHVESIMENGLNKGKRHHIHLSKDYGTSVIVGMRSGSAIILEVDTQSMVKDGFKFFISKNEVYLIDFIPAKYLKVI